MTSPWPSRIWIVRHGESASNVARDRAHAAGLGEIELDIRDVDVPLSTLGHAQSDALGKWFAALPRAERPTVVLTSRRGFDPALRMFARETADDRHAGLKRLLAHAQADQPVPDIGRQVAVARTAGLRRVDGRRRRTPRRPRH